MAAMVPPGRRSDRLERPLLLGAVDPMREGGEGEGPEDGGVRRARTQIRDLEAIGESRDRVPVLDVDSRIPGPP